MRMMVRIAAIVFAGALSDVAFAAAEPNNITGAPTLDGNRPDRAADAPGNQVGPRQAKPPQAAPRAAVAGRDIRAPNAPRRSPSATSRGSTGSARQARGLQHAAQDNTAALRTALRAPVHRGQARQSMVRQGVTRPDPVSTNHAPNLANAPQSSASRTGVITANSRVTGTQTIASNGMRGSRRPPTGLVTIGGAVTNRNANRTVIDGNSVHRRF